MFKYAIILILFVCINVAALPQGFVYLKDVDSTIIQDIKYFTADNFIGKPVKGYEAPTCILTEQAAKALSILQQSLKDKQLSLKVYDCYRPQMAVDNFIVWSKDIKDQKMKAEYYPNVNKADFFKLGYVAEKSSHTRGSTVDITLVHLTDKQELNMGTHFDYMDELSHPSSDRIHGQAKTNRLLLQKLMQESGFSPLETEWWHFTLKNEPYPNTYFNFLVK